MNTILQKRIEEAAYQESSMYDTIQEKNAAYNTWRKIADFALQNQWISTSESLPPLEEASSNVSIGVIAYTSEGVIRYAYYHHYLQQWFSAETSTRIDNVTKWMFVPEEGGEK